MVFNERVLEYYEQHPGLCTECDGKTDLLPQLKLVRPEGMQAFLQEGNDLFNLSRLDNANSRPYAKNEGSIYASLIMTDCSKAFYYCENIGCLLPRRFFQCFNQAVERFVICLRLISSFALICRC